MTSWSSSWKEPGSKSKVTRSRAVSLPSLCCRSMRACPPPISLSRLRRSSSSSLECKVLLRGHATHLVDELDVGRLALADRFRQARARFVLDRVVHLEIVEERPGHDLNSDLGIAELHEAAVLESIHHRPSQELQFPSDGTHRTHR